MQAVPRHAGQASRSNAAALETAWPHTRKWKRAMRRRQGTQPIAEGGQWKVALRQRQPMAERKLSRIVPPPLYLKGQRRRSCANESPWSLGG